MSSAGGVQGARRRARRPGRWPSGPTLRPARARGRWRGRAAGCGSGRPRSPGAPWRDRPGSCRPARRRAGCPWPGWRPSGCGAAASRPPAPGRGRGWWTTAPPHRTSRAAKTTERLSGEKANSSAPPKGLRGRVGVQPAREVHRLAACGRHGEEMVAAAVAPGVPMAEEAGVRPGRAGPWSSPSPSASSRSWVQARVGQSTKTSRLKARREPSGETVRFATSRGRLVTCDRIAAAHGQPPDLARSGPGGEEVEALPVRRPPRIGVRRPDRRSAGSGPSRRRSPARGRASPGWLPDPWNGPRRPPCPRRGEGCGSRDPLHGDQILHAEGMRLRRRGRNGEAGQGEE